MATSYAIPLLLSTGGHTLGGFRPTCTSGLWPHFQEYDPRLLDRDQDADLIIQRTLEHGTWEEIHWLVASYGVERIRKFVRLRGGRLLSAVTFSYWRKLLDVRRWRRAPFAREARQVWPF